MLRWAELASDLFQGDHLAALVLNTILHLNVRHLLKTRRSTSAMAAWNRRRTGCGGR